MTVFEYANYRQYVNAWVKSQEKQGYGYYSRIAEYLGTSTVLISQIFKGDRDLSLEQAAKLSQFMSLGTIETDYFILMIQRARAGNQDLIQILERQLEETREKGQTIKNRIQHQQLTDTEKVKFYSSWYYIATWLAAPITQYSSISKLSSHFGIPEEVIADVVRFLLDQGLLEKKGNKFEFGSNVVHVPADSPFVLQHHLSWRMKALRSMEQKNSASLHYTAPLSLSKELALKIREELIQLIQKKTKQVSDSESETLMCLNLDWFEF